MPPNNSNLKDFMNSCFSSDNLIKQPTCFKSFSPTCIDLIGIRTIAPKANCPPVRVSVKVRVSFRLGGGQFSSGAIFLDSFHNI